MLDTLVLEEKLMKWVREVFVKKPENVIAIDGKAIRGTVNKQGKPFVHMVSAWSCENGISLGQLAVDEKSNEITAMPKLLDMLDIRGAVITGDAMGCQKEQGTIFKYQPKTAGIRRPQGKGTPSDACQTGLFSPHRVRCRGVSGES